MLWKGQKFMIKRVMPYGLGKTFITMKLSELPEDIQEGIIERYEKREGRGKVTKDSEYIVIACEDIFNFNKDNIFHKEKKENVSGIKITTELKI